MSHAILNEVASVKSFFLSRSSDAGNDALAKNFSNALIQQINSCLSLPTVDATLLIDALKDSPYGDVNLKRIIASIDSKVLANSAASKVATASKDQTLKFWWYFCTQGDWDCFKDTKMPFHAKLTKLVERANLLGCTNPDQQAVKWMLSMVLMCHYGDVPAPKEIYEKLQELKHVIVCERKPYPLQQLTEFPDTPAELPEDIFAYAYSDEKPIAMEMAGINSVAEKMIPLRSNHKLLRQSPPAKSSGKQPATQSVVTIDAGEAKVSDVEMTPISCDMPIPGDHVEEQMYASYKSELWRHRAHKQGLLLGSMARSSMDTVAPPFGGQPPLGTPGSACFPCPVPAKWQQNSMGHYERGPAPIKEESQGLPAWGLTAAVPCKQEVPELLMKPRMYGKQYDPALLPNTKSETAPTGNGIDCCLASDGTLVLGQPLKDELEADDGSESLDEYARAAIEALGKRNVRKKTEAAEKAALKAAEKKALKDKTKPAAPKVAAVMKKPAMKSDRVKAEHVQQVAKEVSQADILKAMPKDKAAGNPDPVLYRGGVVYTLQPKKMFRALKVKGDKWTEKSAGWGKTKTKKEAWKACIDAIDDHVKNAKKQKKST